MAEPSWDGVTRAETLTAEAAAVRHGLADRARAADWPAVLATLDRHPELINSTRPGGHAWYTALHQAGYAGAPAAVVERLLALGAWRTLRTRDGERAVDLARRRGHARLVALLEPALRRERPDGLEDIRGHFHALIRERAAALVREHALRLPELEPLLELPTPRLWFPVPGMYGGFSFRLDDIAGSRVLVTESWCRVVGGSGQRHVVSPHGSLLLAAGFV